MHDYNTKLRKPLLDLLYLLEREYPKKPAVELVGNRYGLDGDDRRVLYRGVFPRDICAQRKAKLAGSPPGRLLIDGYNVLITLESYLTGRPVFFCLDGFMRDAAGVFGRYEKSRATNRSIDLLAEFLEEWRGRPPSPGRHALFLLDAPVSRSGELASFLRERFASLGEGVTVEVSRNPDARIIEENAGCGVATSDTVVIDRVDRCVDIPARIIGKLAGAQKVPSLGDLPHAPGG
jgi:hypothetical protein